VLLLVGLGILLFILLAACRPDQVVVTRTVVATRLVQATPVIREVTPTPTPFVRAGRTLVVCMGREPATLYPYGGSTLAMEGILQAVYDGPLDRRDFELRPTIVEKVPSLADGDALIEAVQVARGDAVVNAEGDLVTLQPGVSVRPSGCREGACAVVYDGESPFIMDRLAVTFRFLPGLTWSDGTPLTATDSRYSFDLAADPETPVDKGLIRRTASYEAVDARTIRWVGVPGFLDPDYQDNLWSPYPEHAWGELAAEELLTADISSRRPMGWGPYVVEEWVPGERIQLRWNQRYLRAAEGLPRFETLVYRFVGQDTNANIARLVSGECDLLDQTTLGQDQIDLTLELERSGQASVHFSPGLVMEQVDFGITPASYDDGWNFGDRPDYFGDARTRRAIALCLDRQRVVDEVLGGQSIVPDTYLPPSHPLYNPDVARYAFDVESGSGLLEEVGWADHDSDPATPRIYQGDDPQIPQGVPLTFQYWTTEASQRSQAAQILVDGLAQCGIQAELTLLPVEALYAGGPEGGVFGRQFDLAQFAWEPAQTPPCHLYLSEAIPGDPTELTEEGAPRFPYGWGGWNATGYANPEYDAACSAALRAMPDEPDYLHEHHRPQAILAENLPSVPLYMHLKMAIARPDFCGFQLDQSARSDLGGIESFDYGPTCETR
jgi:peptide/nickel transport system substrate-binding protein